jgi:hypothetical protein
MPGDEAGDYGYTMTNTRRRSNSAGNGGLDSFKTKFEQNEADPDFEEALHGPLPEDDESAAESTSTAGESASASAASVEEEKA